MCLVFNDKYGRDIKLSRERIKHISYHIAIREQIQYIKKTLKFPEILYKDHRNILYYQKYIKKHGMYLIVVVKTFNGHGFIITIYESKKAKR